MAERHDVCLEAPLRALTTRLLRGRLRDGTKDLTSAFRPRVLLTDSMTVIVTLL